MNRKLASGAAAALFALHAVAAYAVLKAGDAAPDFSAQASLGGKTYTRVHEGLSFCDESRRIVCVPHAGAQAKNE